MLGILFTACASGIAASFTWFLKPLLNKGFISPDISFIRWVPFIVIGAYFSLSVTAFLGDYFITWVARHVIMLLQQKLFQKYLKLSAGYFARNSSGQLLAKIIYNAEQVADASTSVILTVIKDVFYIISLVIVMLSNSLLLTLIFLSTLPFISLIVVIAGKIMKKLNLEVQDSVGKVSHIAKEAIEGGVVVNSFSGQQHEIGRFADATWEVCSKQVKVVIANSLGSSSARVVASIAIASSVYLATSPPHILSAGAFMSTIAAMLATLKPLRNLTNVNNQLQKGIAGAESIFSVLDEQDEKDDGVASAGTILGGICYKNVDFSYPNEKKQILKNISFNVKAGETVAIVGRSGSGKSSLVNLLPRFYDCQAGMISIDGIDICNMRLNFLRSQISIVPQKVTLFNDTVAKNIAYGVKIDKNGVYNAAKAAYALEFICDLPDGFNTVVGENGVILSEGQRQRIALARAFFKNSPILILDEATSGLDNESERYIQAALKDLMCGRTTFIIAHRLITVENSDKILLLDAGKLVEIGTHQKLLECNSLYSKLYRKIK